MLILLYRILYIMIEIYPTNYCQLHCYGCYLNNCNKEWSSLDVDSFFNNIDLESYHDDIHILGGEPTLWNLFFYFLQEIRLRNLNSKIIVTTNCLICNNKQYLDKFIFFCTKYNIKINISWHGYNEIFLYANLFKVNNILNNIIFVPNPKIDFNIAKNIFMKYTRIYPCIWRPFISKNKEELAINKKLKMFNTTYVECSNRNVNDCLISNIDFMIKGDYTKYICNCSDNIVYYLDAKKYYCLSQAINNNSAPIYNNNWIKCTYDFCCCDIFDLRIITS